MGWGFPLDVDDLIARAQKRGDDFVKALALDTLEREDEKLSAVAWEVGRGWFPTLPDRATLHSGLDIGLPDGGGDSYLGAPVLAIGDGDVVYADTMSPCSEQGYDFGRVIVRHPTAQGDAYALYMQLGTVMTFLGSQVKQGDPLGSVGWHGRFHHLHFAVASQQPLGGDSDLIPEVEAGQWPDGDGLWNVLRVKVNDLDPAEWPYMPPGPWYLIHPIEFVRAMRGDEYRHYVGAGSPHIFVSDPTTVASQAQRGQDNVHKAEELLKFDALKSNERLLKLAHGEGDPIAKGDGDKDAIIALQTTLNACEFSTGRSGPNHDGIDGDFGKTTERVLTRFQKEVVKQQMAELLGSLGKTPDDVAADGKLDRLTLLALDVRATAKTGSSGGSGPAAGPAAGSDSPSAKPPPPVILADNAPWIFDGVAKKQSIKFGLRLYRALLKWELTDWIDKDGNKHKARKDGSGNLIGCLYSGDHDGGYKPYRAKFDEFFKDATVPRWRPKTDKKGKPLKDDNGNVVESNTMTWTEWPQIDLCEDLFGPIKADSVLTVGANKYKVYSAGGAIWVADHRTNCCNSQFAAFFVAVGGQQVSARTSGGDKVYWLRASDQDHQFHAKSLEFEKAMMCNFAAFYEHGGGLEGMQSLGIGDAVGSEGGAYTINQETLLQVRIADWANTPGHAWLVGDIKYGIWLKGKQSPEIVAQSSLVGDDPKPGGPVRLEESHLAWLDQNETTFMTRVQSFIDGCLKDKKYKGKDVEKFEVVDVCQFTANGFVSTVHGVRYREITEDVPRVDKKGKPVMKKGTQIIDKKGTGEYEPDPNNPEEYWGISRKWVGKVPDSSSPERDKDGNLVKDGKVAGPGASYCRFYGPA